MTKSGITFSGNWCGPKLFDERVTMTGRPCVVWWLSAMRSLPALEAEYGERGPSASLSRNEPSAIEPYTSSVEMWTKRSTPTSRAASQSTLVPEQFVRTNASGSTMERSTWVSAAKWTTASWPAMASRTASRSQMSPRTNRNRGSSSTSARLLRSPA